MSKTANLLVVVVMLLATSGCVARPEVAANAADACHWPYGCNVRPEKVQEVPTLVGRAALPADTFTLGPSSGSKLPNEINGRKLPFKDQPVQGFSAVLDAGEKDTYWALTDNGYGTRDNSSDFLLRTYRIQADFEAGRGTSGDLSFEGYIRLRDPDRHVPFPITNEMGEDRLLTGADFDPESVQRDRAGDLWFGEEYGPFLLHTDATGQVLEAPIQLPGVWSPQNPYLSSSEQANLPSSKGFEGMAISDNGRFLYPMLGGALTYDAVQSRRFIYEFDLNKERYTGERWQYKTDDPKNTITDLAPIPGDPRHRLLILERSSVASDGVKPTKVYMVDLHDTGASGYLVKREVLELPQPQIESIMAIGDRRLLVLNDNDYPYTTNDTEAIVIQAEGLPEGS
jgi:glycerophosphoryl diester phosphodiesterase